MSSGHQIIINCGLNTADQCQLAEESLTGINIKTQHTPAQYNYYLLIHNYLKDTCQLSLEAGSKQELKEQLWSKIFVKIFYQNQALFDDNLQVFFQQKINLLTIVGDSFKLYRLEFYLAEVVEEFQTNFFLKFKLNCQQAETAHPQNQEVLGLQSEQGDPQDFPTQAAVAPVATKHMVFVIICLIIFIFFFILIFLIYRSIFPKSNKKKKVLISSKKGNL